MGISQEMYHLFAVSGGIVSGAMIVVGFTILVYRRRTVSTVFNATTINDKVMYLVLGLTIVPAILGGYRQLGVLRRLRTTPASPTGLLAALFVAVAAVGLVVTAATATNRAASSPVGDCLLYTSPSPRDS